MALFTLLVTLPSPIKKLEPKTVALKTPAPTVQKAVETQPIATPKPEEPKPFDVNDRSTWPVCAENQIVWAQDGQCHEKPAQAASVAQASVPAQEVPSDNQSIMAQAGIAPGDYAAVDYVISHESGWRWWVKNNEGSGATGLCQALPGSKMASAGADWATNPVTQLKWCNSYAIDRYGGWWNARAVGISRDTTGSGWGWW